MPQPKDHADWLEIQEFNRRLEAIAERISTLSTRIEVLSDRQTQTIKDIEKLDTEMAQLSKLANRGMGIVLALTLLGGVIGGFWEKVSKIFH